MIIRIVFLIKCAVRRIGCTRVPSLAASSASSALMGKSLLVFLSVLFASCWNKTVVSFEGGSISAQDIQEEAQSKMFKLRKEEYEIQKRVAYDMALKEIVKLEAKKKKLNEKVLVETYVEKNFQPPTEATLQEYYKYNQKSFNKSFQAARQEIHEQVARYTKKNLEDRYYQELAKNYKLRVELKEPLPPHVEIDTKNEPFWGNSNAKVVVVEYSDFECPYCQRMQPDAQRIRKEYKDKIKWVFKDFPLSFHRNARKAHIAANCASEQDKFFEYQSKIFVPSADLSPQNLMTSASDIGLNITQFKKCLADQNGERSKEIDVDIQTGSESGVRGTPTVFINGRLATQFRSYQGMKQAIDEELERVGVN